MKKLFLWLALLLTLFPAWAEGARATPTFSPTFTPALSFTPTITSTPDLAATPRPTATSEPVNYYPTLVPITTPGPESTPSEKNEPGTSPQNPGPGGKGRHRGGFGSPKKDNKWLSSIGLGAALPMSANLRANYSLGLNVSLGTGYQLTDRLSAWADVDFDYFGASPNSIESSNGYTIVGLALWLRYCPFGTNLRPYLFAGPGLAYNEVRSTGTAVYDYYTGLFYYPINAYEFDFTAEGGLGLEYKVSDGLRLFLQGKITYDFTSENFAGNALTDSPAFFIPIQTGIIFGF
jgi:hypothetical protein